MCIRDRYDADDTTNNYLGPDAVIPTKIEDVKDDIIKQILRCEVTGKPYKSFLRN